MKPFVLISTLCIVLFPGNTSTMENENLDTYPLFSVEFTEPELTIFEIASAVTGCPKYILAGISFAESSGNQFAIGDDGMSIGRFQINETYHEYYATLYGEYNPYCPLDSAILTGRIYMDNLRALGNIEDAIAAHRQGRTGVKNNGRTQWYVDRVLNYSKRYAEESWNIDI